MAELRTLTKVSLPEAYLDFVSNHNGGICRQETITLDNCEEVFCECLFGLGLRAELDIVSWQREFLDDLPENCIPIGCDPGGGFFLLLHTNAGWKVMYYDHSYSFPTSNDDSNTYECNINLGRLLEMVESPFRA